MKFHWLLVNSTYTIRVLNIRDICTIIVSVINFSFIYGKVEPNIHLSKT